MPTKPITVSDKHGQPQFYEVGFCGEPTADGDNLADVCRQFYERNRETWWERHAPFSFHDRDGIVADEWMLRFVEFVSLAMQAQEDMKAEWQASQVSINNAT